MRQPPNSQPPRLKILSGSLLRCDNPVPQSRGLRVSQVSLSALLRAYRRLLVLPLILPGASRSIVRKLVQALTCIIGSGGDWYANLFAAVLSVTIRSMFLGIDRGLVRKNSHEATNSQPLKDVAFWKGRRFDSPCRKSGVNLNVVSSLVLSPPSTRRAMSRQHCFEKAESRCQSCLSESQTPTRGTLPSLSNYPSSQSTNTRESGV